MTRKTVAVTARLPLAFCLAYGVLAAAAESPSAPNATPAPGAAAPAHPQIVVPRSQNAEMYIRRRWGIDTISVRSLSSGAAVEFRYRVVDPAKAAVLNDRKATPVLTDQISGLRLSVPQMENVGTLRQVAPPVAGKEYWMIFQDPRRVVKPGHRVDIAVGVLHLNGLTVQ
jgi:hypothetical protein